MKGKWSKKVAFSCILFGSALFVSTNLTGCQKKELTKEEVTETSYYKNLKKKYKSLKSEKEDLEEQLKEATKTQPDDKRATTYLKKLQKDSIIKLEVAKANDASDTSESVYFKQKAVLKSAKSLIKKADLTMNYTPDTLKKDYDAKYVYTLYDEDNSVFEITVYEGNYIVFSDLPHKVYYCYNADVFGNAFLQTEEEGSEELSLLYRLEHSFLVLKSDEKAVHMSPTIETFAQTFDETEKEEMENGTQDSEKKQAAYTFYENAEEITLTMYETQISIAKEDETTVWYRVSKDNMKKLKEILD